MTITGSINYLISQTGLGPVLSLSIFKRIFKTSDSLALKDIQPCGVKRPKSSLKSGNCPHGAQINKTYKCNIKI